LTQRVYIFIALGGIARRIRPLPRKLNDRRDGFGKERERSGEGRMLAPMQGADI